MLVLGVISIFQHQTAAENHVNGVTTVTDSEPWTRYTTCKAIRCRDTSHYDVWCFHSTWLITTKGLHTTRPLHWEGPTTCGPQSLYIVKYSDTVLKIQLQYNVNFCILPPEKLTLMSIVAVVKCFLNYVSFGPASTLLCAALRERERERERASAGRTSLKWMKTEKWW